MKGRLWGILTLLFAWTIVNGQTGLSFYNLGGATFQNSQYNPVYIPNGKFMLGLPVLSGIHLHYNNKHSYQEIFRTTEAGNPKIDLQKIYRNMGVSNMVSTQVNISLLHMALRFKNGGSVSLFANERIETDFLYPQRAMDVLVNGNSVQYDKPINIGKIRFNGTHFREIGMGYTLYSKDLKLTVGTRIKYLQGVFNASTPGNQQVSLRTDADTYELKGNLSNASLRTSGIDILSGEEGDLLSHVLNSGNSGGAIDLGFHWEMSRYTAIAASITDLGFISWKTDIQNYSLSDTTFTYSGFDLKNPGSVENTIKDSLINRFKIKKNEDTYTTLIGPKLFASHFYHINPQGEVVTSIGTRFIQGSFKTMVGIGYQHRLGNFFTGSINLTKLPQQFFNVGAAFAVKGGPAQLYVAADQVATWDLTRFQSIDVRVGINFVFNTSKPKVEKNTRAGGPGVDYFEKPKVKGPNFSVNQSFMGEKVKVKRSEGIYNIIPLQKRRKIDEDLLTPEER